MEKDVDTATGMTQIRAGRESVTVTDEQLTEFAGRLRALGRVDIASELVKRHAIATSSKSSAMHVLNAWRDEAGADFPEELRLLRYAIDEDLAGPAESS